MDITNLSPSAPIVGSRPPINYPLLVIIVTLAIGSGFWLSRLSSSGSKNSLLSGSSGQIISSDKIDKKEDIQAGKVYGNVQKTFSDSATGSVEKGSINGEGTHILNREGGLSQRASLTSSVLDLDLFVGRKVEVKGETNASNKTSWLMDVGSIKVLE